MSAIKRLLRGVKRRIKGKSLEESNHQWLLEHGLREGKKVDCFSWSGMDFQYPGLITIGNEVTIAAHVKILAHDAGVGYLTKSTRIGIVEISDHVFIGYGATILCNVHIGEWSVIGAGSVVTKDIPAGCVYAGNPARFICTTQAFQQKHEQMMRGHPVFSKPWREWPEMSSEEWEAARSLLQERHGYVTARAEIEGKIEL